MKKLCQLERLIPVIIIIIMILIIVKCFPQNPRKGEWSQEGQLGEGHSPPASHRSVGAARLPSALVPLSRGGLTSSGSWCELVCPYVCLCRWVLEGDMDTRNANVCGQKPLRDCEFPWEECKCNWTSKVPAVGLVLAPGGCRRGPKGRDVGPSLEARTWREVSAVTHILRMGGT